jgi:hypothetical protein
MRRESSSQEKSQTKACSILSIDRGEGAASFIPKRDAPKE